MVSVLIDSTGAVETVAVDPFVEKVSINNVEYTCPLSPFDSVFIEPINAACHKVVWLAGKVNGRAATMKAEFPVIFNFYSYQTPTAARRMIIREVVRRIDTQTTH